LRIYEGALMEQLRFQCQVEDKVTNHAVMSDELPLGDKIVFVQCLSCGSPAINQLADAIG
jgi:hypothetical protein